MDKAELLEREIARLSASPPEWEKPSNLGVVRFIAACPGNSWEVIANAKKALSVVSSESLDRWPATDRWEKILPDWFVKKCAPEMSPEEAERWLTRWQSLSADEQEKEEKVKRWTLPDWLYWLEPQRRDWFWWDATERDRNTVILAVEVIDWPFPWGALSWLLRASGAMTVKAEE